MKATKKLIEAAHNCGIDASGLTVEQIEEAYKVSRGDDNTADQFDMYFREAVKDAIAVNKTADRLAAQFFAKPSVRQQALSKRPIVLHRGDKKK